MEKGYYVCVEYETIREHKVYKFKCYDLSKENLAYGIANVTLFEEKDKFVKIKKTWFEKVY